MTRDEVRELADLTLMSILGPVGFVSTDGEAKSDHVGDDSLHVTVHFSPDATVASGRTYLDAQTAMARALALHGEDRFPYLAYDHREAEADGDEEREGAWLRP